MTAPAPLGATYRHLNLERAWPSFALSGLVVDDAGALSLAPLPLLADALGEPLAPAPGVEGLVGITVAACGTIYAADAARHRILRVDDCATTAEPLHCLRGPGSGPGELDHPRGVLAGPRGALYVADSGNARVVVIDRATDQVRDVWGVPRSEPRPSDAPGGFVQPWDLAADRFGYVYVADPGERAPDGTWARGRVQKLRADGSPVHAFADAMRDGALRPGAPVGVATVRLDAADRASERLLVLDRQPARVLVYALDGTLDAAATERWGSALASGAPPSALAAGDGVLYVADAHGRVLAFGADGAFRGVAPEGAAAAGLAIDCAGRLVLNPGAAGGSLLRAADAPAYAACGTFLAGPFDAPSEPTRWQRLELDADALPDGAHLVTWTLTSDTLDGVGVRRPSHPAPCDAAADATVVAAERDEPAPLDRWRAAVPDATSLLAANAPGRWLWIAGALVGDGTQTPTLRQLRLTHDEDGWLAHLPQLYHRPESGRAFLERMLAACESVLDESDRQLDAMPRLFDAHAAPDGPARPGWLDWLAGWVDAELRESWPAATRRAVVAGAFGAHARRGTLQRLRELVALHAGATPLIEEDGARGLWSLGASPLGFDTALGEAAPQGAVLATTAVVDRSHLTDGDDWGAPAFARLAHHFTVHVFEAELRGADALAHVRRVLDAEKPAHTTYTLCTIGARARVGATARVGVDAIVGGPPDATPLGTASADGGGRRAALVLGGDPTRSSLPTVGDARVAAPDA